MSDPRADGKRRRPRRSAVAVLVAGAALALASAGNAEAKAKPGAEFFGIVPLSLEHGKDIPQMAANGIGTLRATMFWPSIESQPGNFDWTLYDGIISEAAQNGIRVFPSLLGTASWANLFAGQSRCGVLCAPNVDLTRNAFASFARAAVERYGPGGAFWRPSGGDCDVPSLCPVGPPACQCTTPLPIKSWQIWNEQNSPKYFRPAPNPHSYAALVDAAGGAIRDVDPGAEIVLGGMWGPPDAKSVMPTTEYLRRLYAIPGIEKSFDAIAVHPYAPGVDGVVDQISRVRKAVKQAGDPGARTWITELGWASGGPRSNGLVKTLKGQARLLRDTYEYLIRKRVAWKIRGVTWYTWRDAAPGEADCEWCPKAGLRTRGGAQKPAARAFKRLARGTR